MKLAIAWRQWDERTIFYVAQLKGKVGDWGYTKRIDGNNGLDKAIALTPYWQRRFAADCRAVGAVARFIEL